MKKVINIEYGLELTMNSKVGPAFSLSRSSSCVNKTKTCERVCYGNGIRYRSVGQTNKRMRNFKTAEFLLQHGGSELLAENLVAVVDQARPIDYLAASITKTETAIPWTLRIHDVGDFYSVDYVRAWIMTAQQRKHCRFWFYTRSFVDPELFQELSELASLNNVRGFLSLDVDNYDLGLLRFSQSEAGIWRIALLQEKFQHMPERCLEEIDNRVGKGELIVFPKHHGGRHVAPIERSNYTICPQVLGNFKLESRPSFPKPCQACTICLP